MDLKDVSYVEIDDADEERTHLLVTVNDADGAVIEIIIEQYPLEERVRAHAMARRLSGLLGLPLKLLKDRDCEGADHHRCRFSKCRSQRGRLNPPEVYGLISDAENPKRQNVSGISEI